MTEQSKKPNDNPCPPANTQRILRWNDLPSTTERAAYEVTKADGATHLITAGRNKQRVLEGLIRAPMFCASFCRISHYVSELRDDDGVGIKTHWFKNDKNTNRERFGIYELSDKVRRVA